MLLTDYKVLTFDCYGTLIDWETGMVEALKPLTSRASRSLTRDEILEAHARHEASQERHTPWKLYRNLLPVVYKRMAGEWSISVKWDECVAYGHSVRHWPAFSNSVNALLYLKKRYIDNETFEYSNKKLEVEFDAILTAEDIGSYKPSLHNFEYMVEQLARCGLHSKDILHTAGSLFHDVKPANTCGLDSCYIDRRHEQPGLARP